MRWRTLGLTLVLSLSSLWFVWSQSEKRVTIELKDAPIVDAFDQLFRAAGENYIIQPNVLKEQRLTMRLVDVPFEKALNFLCELTGLKWERKDGVYIISATQRGVMGGAFFEFKPFVEIPPTGMSIPMMPMQPKELMPRIEMPHGIPLTGGPIAIACAEPFNICTRCRQVVTRQCPKCNRPMEFRWNFCPFDGTKLLPAPEKCPKCGAPLPKVTKPSQTLKAK